MSAVLTDPPITLDAYLVWEEQQPERHEFFAGEVFAMTGARATHNTIAGNLFAFLKQAMRGAPCRVFISDMKLQVASANASFYPDVFVTCDPRDRTADAELVQRHPVFIAEVLSESTAAFDRGQKFETYRQLDSLKAYLVVEQNRLHADLFFRNAEGLWVLNAAGEGESLAIAPLELSLPMALVYEGADFSPPDTSAESAKAGTTSASP